VDELKACPFCGEQPDFYWNADSSCLQGYNLVCCYVHIFGADEQEAEKAWNTRCQT